MAVSNWDCIDNWVADNGSQNLGNGEGPRLFLGRSTSGTWDNRFSIGFARPTSGSNLIPAGATITKATVYLKVRGDASCFGRGAFQKILIRRVNPTSHTPGENTASGDCALSENGSGTTKVWPGAGFADGTSLVTGDQTFWDLGDPATGAVVSKEITATFLGWWGARAGGDNWFTVTFLPSNAAGNAEEMISQRRASFDSADADGSAIFNGGRGPYLKVEYTTTNPPNAPALTSPGDGSVVSQPSNTRALAFTYSHPDGTAGTDYEVRVSTNVGMSAIVCTKAVTQALVNNTSYNISLNTVSDFTVGDETRGVQYWWQVRCRSGGSGGTWGAYSGVRSYKVNSLPTVSKTRPAGTA